MDRCEAHAVNPDRRCKRRGTHRVAGHIMVCWQHNRVLWKHNTLRLHPDRAIRQQQTLVVERGQVFLAGQTQF